MTTQVHTTAPLGATPAEATPAEATPTPASTGDGAAPTERSGRRAQLVLPGVLGPVAAVVRPDGAGWCMANGLSSLERTEALHWLRQHMDVTGKRFEVLDLVAHHDGPNGLGCFIGLRGMVARRVVGHQRHAVAALAWLRGAGLLRERKTPKRCYRHVLLPVACYEHAVAYGAAAGEGAPRARAVSAGQRGSAQVLPKGAALTRNRENEDPPTTYGPMPPGPAPAANGGGGGGQDANAGGASRRAQGEAPIDAEALQRAVFQWAGRQLQEGAPPDAVADIKAWALSGQCQHPNPVALSRALSRRLKRGAANGEKRPDWQPAADNHQCEQCGCPTSTNQRRCNDCILASRAGRGA